MSNFDDRVMEVVGPHLSEIRDRFRELPDSSTAPVVESQVQPQSYGVPGIKPEIDRIEKMLTQLLKDNSDDSDPSNDEEFKELTDALWQITDINNISGFGDFWDKLLKALVATTHTIFGNNDINLEVAPGKFKFLSQLLSSGLDPRTKALGILAGLLAGPLAKANSAKSKERQRTLQALFNMISAIQNNEALDSMKGLLLKIENEVNRVDSSSAKRDSVMRKKISMIEPAKQQAQLLSVVTDQAAIKAELSGIRGLLQQRIQSNA